MTEKQWTNLNKILGQNFGNIPTIYKCDLPYQILKNYEMVDALLSNKYYDEFKYLISNQNYREQINGNKCCFVVICDQIEMEEFCKISSGVNIWFVIQVGQNLLLVPQKKCWPLEKTEQHKKKKNSYKYQQIQYASWDLNKRSPDLLNRSIAEQLQLIMRFSRSHMMVKHHHKFVRPDIIICDHNMKDYFLDCTTQFEDILRKKVILLEQPLPLEKSISVIDTKDEGCSGKDNKLTYENPPNAKVAESCIEVFSDDTVDSFIESASSTMQKEEEAQKEKEEEAEKESCIEVFSDDTVDSFIESASSTMQKEEETEKEKEEEEAEEESCIEVFSYDAVDSFIESASSTMQKEEAEAESEKEKKEAESEKEKKEAEEKKEEEKTPKTHSTSENLFKGSWADFFEEEEEEEIQYIGYISCLNTNCSYIEHDVLGKVWIKNIHLYSILDLKVGREVSFKIRFDYEQNYEAYNIKNIIKNGILKFYNFKNEFGFVTYGKDGKDLYFNKKNLINDPEPRSLVQGANVSFYYNSGFLNKTGGKPFAERITLK